MDLVVRFMMWCWDI